MVPRRSLPQSPSAEPGCGPTACPKASAPSRTLRNLKNLKTTLLTPPSIKKIAPRYHTLRRDIILAVLGQHFAKSPKNPIPLLGKDLLDVGCGKTPIGCMMALAGAEVTVIDPNPTALQACATDADNFGTPLTVLNTKAEKLLTSPMRYDVVLALDVLAEHPTPQKMLWVLQQLLKPQGVLVVGHTSRTFRAWLYHIFLSRMIFQRVATTLHWRRFHTPTQLHTLAQKHNLAPFNTTLLRYSMNGMRWKITENRHYATRFLTFYKVPEKA